MREERLLERIARVSGERHRGAVRDEELVLASIISYLNKILNTRKGSVLMDPEFGVPDYSGMASRFSTAVNETLDDIETSVRDAVTRYEPRLASPKIKFLDKEEFELSLFLELEATVKTGPEPIPVTLKIRMSPNGSIVVGR
ncbi:MAG TPA: type VI secretion system baseplate subunit TssE [bacterium]|nr:type VI secretion system baseplate subunit TssE [bacterium]